MTKANPFYLSKDSIAKINAVGFDMVRKLRAERDQRVRQTMVRLRDIRKGQVFWECESGSNDQFTAVEDAALTPRGWSVMATDIGLNNVEFFEAFGHEGSLRIYHHPQYA